MGERAERREEREREREKGESRYQMQLSDWPNLTSPFCHIPAVAIPCAESSQGHTVSFLAVHQGE